VALRADLFKVIKAAIDGAGETNHGSITAPAGSRIISKEVLKAYCGSMDWQDPAKPKSFRTMLARHLSGLRSQDLIGFDRHSVWLA
jgi:hypothetical protein